MVKKGKGYEARIVYRLCLSVFFRLGGSAWGGHITFTRNRNGHRYHSRQP